LFHRNFDCLGIKAAELKGRLRVVFSLVGGATPFVKLARDIGGSQYCDAQRAGRG